MAKTKQNATKAERQATAAAVRKLQTKDRGKVAEVTPDYHDDVHLFRALQRLGATVGPINDSTRSLYRRRLNKLMKEKGVENLDQIVESNEEEEKAIDKPKNKRGGRRGKKTPDGEEENKVDAPIAVQMEKTVNPKNKSVNTIKPVQKNADSEEKLKADASIPVKKQTKKLKNQNGREKDKKVSFAPIEVRDEERSEEEETLPLQSEKKKREPSVQILAVRTNAEDNKRARKENKIPEYRKSNVTIVIEEETDEDESEEKGERRGVRDEDVNDDEEEEEMNDVDSHDSPIVIRRESRGIRSSVEEDEESQEEGEAISALVSEEEEVVDPAPIYGETEDEDGEENERGEDSPPRRPMIIRAMLSVDTPQERRFRRNEANRRMESMGEEGKEKEEDHRRMTIDIFNRKSRPSHRSTMNIFHGKTSLDGRIKDQEESAPLPLMRNILEETEDMDISNGSEQETITGGQKKLVNIMGDISPHREMIRDLSRPLFVDDSEDMEISNTPQDRTFTVRNKIDPMFPLGRDVPLLSDTPSSSRSKNEKEKGKREERESSRALLRMRDPICPLEDFFYRGHLEDSVGMGTFNEGIDREGTTSMNSTPNSNLFGKTFIVKDMSRKTKTPSRVTRNIVRSPSRSPARDRNRTYVISQSPTRLGSVKKSWIVPTPTRSRAPPKPMPRRIIGTNVSSEAPSSLVAPPPSVPVAPPVPAPRRLVTTRVVDESIESRFDVNAKKEVVEKRGEGTNEVSPASLFLTQPRLREKMEKERVFTPVDRKNIEKLHSLREKMRVMRREGQPTGRVDYEARMIIETSPYLKEYFY